jgi:hypothetical protein
MASQFTERPRPRYDASAKTRRKCGFCGATQFRVVIEEPVDTTVFKLLVCDNADCGAVIGGGPVA